FSVSVTDSDGLSDTQDILLQVLDVPDDDSVFALQSNDTILVNEAAGNATVTAVRTGNAQSRVTVEYTLNETSGPDSAQANVDYTEPTFAGRPNTGQIVFEAGQTEATFTIPIINDTAFETNESFAIGLQNPSAGTLGAPRTALVTIVDDDVPAELSISTTDVSVGEGAATASVTVQRSGDITGTASVEFTTGNGTAIAGSDYTATSGILAFTAGQTSQTIDVPIRDDIAVENNETFSVTLSNPTGAALGSQTTSTITILDNDLELGNLIRTTAVSGLIQPTTLDWTPDGRYLLVAEKSGVVKVVDNGTLRSTPLVNLSAQVNDTRDRGLLGLAIHPDFPNTPYVYLLHTYDPPETLGRTNLGGPDGNGNR
ncbi:MAG: Calx-beta domain-containing protein, partial [Cyanobacteria bacterium J06576_12]